jgi:DNA-binding FadR family transcriptional regulator
MPNQQVPEKAVRIIMKDIFTHKLKPGTKLPSAKELSKQLHIDLSSLRIALKRLEAMNLLHIKQGDGIYVKDYVKHAGIDFLSLLFTHDEANGEDYVIDECLIDEVWEYWTMFFPEMLKLASLRLSSLKDLKALRTLLDEEYANIRNREKVIELEIQQQDLVVDICNNTIIFLLSNSSRPMRKKIIEIFVRAVSDEELRNFINMKKSLLNDFAKQTKMDANAVAEKYRELLSMNRQILRQKIIQNDYKIHDARSERP